MNQERENQKSAAPSTAMIGGVAVFVCLAVAAVGGLWFLGSGTYSELRSKAQATPESVKDSVRRPKTISEIVEKVDEKVEMAEQAAGGPSNREGRERVKKILSGLTGEQQD